MMFSVHQLEIIKKVLAQGPSNSEGGDPKFLIEVQKLQKEVDRRIRIEFMMKHFPD